MYSRATTSAMADRCAFPVGFLGAISVVGIGRQPVKNGDVFDRRRDASREGSFLWAKIPIGLGGAGPIKGWFGTSSAIATKWVHVVQHHVIFLPLAVDVIPASSLDDLRNRVGGSLISSLFHAFAPQLSLLPILAARLNTPVGFGSDLSFLSLRRQHLPTSSSAPTCLPSRLTKSPRKQTREELK